MPVAEELCFSESCQIRQPFLFEEYRTRVFVVAAFLFTFCYLSD